MTTGRTSQLGDIPMKKQYQKPVVNRYGDVEVITQNKGKGGKGGGGKGGGGKGGS